MYIMNLLFNCCTGILILHFSVTLVKSMFISLNVYYSFEGVAATPKEMVKKLTEKW